MRIVLAIILSLSLSALLTGCSLTGTAPPTPYAGVAITGKVHGGAQPVTGAQVYLYAANTAGYGTASISLLNANVLVNNPARSGLDSNGNYYVTTDSTGSFSISGDYACTAGQEVYIYVIGGNPGAGINAASSFMAVLGDCPGPTFSTALLVYVNEVTTVAAGYAFAGFATDALHVSSSGTALAVQGVANAFANAANLANLGTGAAQLSINAGYGTAPQATVNTLANILASCINTAGAVNGPTSPTPCYTLFYNARANGSTGTVPTETATAIINIAHNPGQNITPLYALPGPVAAFAPALASSSPPNDFTLGLQLTGGGIDVPYAVAIDGNGYVWLANNASFMAVFGPNGAPVTPSTGGYAGIGGVGTYGAGLQGNFHLAIDTSNNVWVSEVNTTYIAEFNGSSAPAYVKSIKTTGYSSPGFVTIDPSGNIWVTNGGGTPSVFEIAAGTSTITDYPGNGLSGSRRHRQRRLRQHLGQQQHHRHSLRIHQRRRGDNRVAVRGRRLLFLPTRYRRRPQRQRLDPQLCRFHHLGLADRRKPRGGWNRRCRRPSLIPTPPPSMEPVTPGSPTPAPTPPKSPSSTAQAEPLPGTAGYGYASLNHFGGNGVDGIAVDGSGNVWCVDSQTGNGGTLVELIGAAVPTITPIALAVKNNTIGTRP